MDSRLDTGAARALVARGVVTEAAVSHAQAVQARDYRRNPILELLVDLELVEEGALVDALSRMTGAPIWDGRIAHPELAGQVRVALAQPLARDGDTIHYATSEPHDDGLRQAVRMAAGATRAEPQVASATMLAKARAKILGASPGLEDEVLPATVIAPRPASAEAELREQWFEREGRDDDSPLRRLVSALLLDQVFAAPGGAMRVEVFDEPVVRGGVAGCFGEAVPGLPALAHPGLLQQLVWVHKAMADLPPEPGSFQGWINVLAGRMRTAEIFVEDTERGVSLVAVRTVAYEGIGLPRDGAFDPLRHLLAACEEARQIDDVESHVQALRAALAEADSLGELAVVDRVSLRHHLGDLLDQHHREREAQRLVDQAWELARAHRLGGRAEARLLELRARLEVTDLARRTAMLAQAEEAVRAAGPGFRPALRTTLVRAYGVLRGRCSEDVLPICDALESNDVAWFGARSRATYAAWMMEAEARATLGQPELATAALDRATALGRRLGIAWGWEEHLTEGAVLASAGRHEGAIATLRHALACDAEGAPVGYQEHFVGLALASSLEATGKGREAKALAEVALQTPGDALTEHARSKLDSIRRRTTPYR